MGHARFIPAAFLSYYDWLDTGDPAAWQAWQEGKREYDAAVAGHVSTYGQDLDTPAYSFFAVDAGLPRAAHTFGAKVVTAAVIVAILGLVLLGGPLGMALAVQALGTAARALLGSPGHGAWLTRPQGLLRAAGLVASGRDPGAEPRAFSNWLSWSYLLATLGSIACSPAASAPASRP